MAVEAELLSLADVRAAADRIAPYVRRTPLLSGEAIGGEGIWLKAENLQRTGSFKIRGAFNAMLQLSPEQRAQGVITLSAGNHGLALACASQTFGVPCTIVVREDASVAKLEAIRRFGAEIVLTPFAEWQARLEAEQRRRGAHLVHPFDDPAIVCGQGTVGLEILDALPEVRTVLVPIGGGGLISGVALALKGDQPAVRIIGVEPVGAAAMSESLEAGRPMAASRFETVADGLAAPYTRPLTFELVRRYVDEVRRVSDDAILDALRAIASKAKLVVEPAGAAAVALLSDAAIEHPAVAILSGGNLDATRFARWLAER